MKFSESLYITMNKLTALIVLTAFLVSCEDFGDTNVDPNNPQDAQTEMLMTQAQRSVGTYVGGVEGTLFVQYFAETQYTDASTYDQQSFGFGSGYTGNAYSGPLKDLQEIIDLNSDEETRESSNVVAGGDNDNQIAVATILQAYIYQTLTDRWGMVPYEEALDDEENTRPAYSEQADIYEGLIQELKDAIDLINDGDGPTGDFIFEGDMGKWERFANTLRMRLALRLADRGDEVDIDPAAEFEEAYQDGPVEEDIMFPYLADSNNENPWYNRFRTRTDYAISDTMANLMKDLDDIRLTRFADPAPNEDKEDDEVTMDEIVGMPYGLAGADAGDIENAEISFPGTPMRGQDTPLPIFTMAELHFSLAEAIERGWMSGDAESEYEDGIEASWRQWEVYDENDFNDYISQSDISYDSDNWEQKIGLQKWIGLFPQGYEAWAEWRRLDYPELEPAPAANNNSEEIPVRHGYPADEPELNEENYEEALDIQGEDRLSTNIFWDVE